MDTLKDLAENKYVFLLAGVAIGMAGGYLLFGGKPASPPPPPPPPANP